MILSETDISYLTSVFDTLKKVGIDEMVINSKALCGVNDDKTIFLIQNEDIPDWDFEIAFTRFSTLLAKIQMTESDKAKRKIEVKTKTINDIEIATALSIKSTTTKINAACLNPKLVVAPSVLKDPIIDDIGFDSEAMSDILSSASSAFTCSQLTLEQKEDEIILTISDIQNTQDTLEVKLEATKLADEDFCHTYPFKLSQTLFKISDAKSVKLSKKGILNIEINGLNFYMLPMV